MYVALTSKGQCAYSDHRLKRNPESKKHKIDIAKHGASTLLFRNQNLINEDYICHLEHATILMVLGLSSHQEGGTRYLSF
jgi:hypothetical protein